MVKGEKPLNAKNNKLQASTFVFFIINIIFIYIKYFIF